MIHIVMFFEGKCNFLQIFKLKLSLIDEKFFYCIEL